MNVRIVANVMDSVDGRKEMTITNRKDTSSKLSFPLDHGSVTVLTSSRVEYEGVWRS